MTPANQPSIWQRIFGMDLRSLAAFRIVFGVLLLVDLWMRLQSLVPMYTDSGIMPLDMHAEYLRSISDRPGAFSWSLHALNGSWQWQAVLFALTGIAYVMFTVGYRTRFFAVVSWILLVSIQVRNPLILHSGDTVFRVAMFWSMFLPLGAWWSVDARRRRTLGLAPPRSLEFTSPATAGLILLLFSLYFFAGVAKMNGVWYSGLAMEYVSRLDIYSTALGKLIREYPALLQAATWATLAAEVILPFFLFIPWRNRQFRMLLLVVFCSLHIGIALTMSIGLFQYVSMSIWLAMIPGSVWDRLGRWFSAARRPEYASDSSVSGIATWQSRLVWGTSLFFVFYFLLWNIATITQIPACQNAMPKPLRFVGRHLNMRQEFRMFDIPPAYSPWFVYDAKLADGSHVDIFRNQPVSYDRPDSILATISGHHWRRIHRNLVRDDENFKPFRKRMAEYMMERWNATHGKHEQIVSLKLTVYMDEITPYRSEPEGQIVQVWSHLGDEVVQEDLFDDLLKQMKKTGEILP